MTVAVSQEFPTVNEKACSWADISTTINISGGATLKDIDYSGFKANSTLELGEQRGASGGRVMKRTSGSLKDEASATYYKSGFRTLVTALMVNAPTRGNQRLVGQVEFNISVKHSVPGDDSIYELVIVGARLTKWDATMAEGNEADKLEIDLNPLRVFWKINGLEVVLA